MKTGTSSLMDGKDYNKNNSQRFDEFMDIVKQLPKQEISDESWEGCDGCTEQDEIMYKNGYVKGYNAASSQTTSDKWKEYQDWLNEPPELSDEEIEKAVMDSMDYVYLNPNDSLIFHQGWMRAIKWYREQLKQRQ